MVSFSPLDIIIIVVFFILLIFIGFLSGKKTDDAAGYLLSGRNVGLWVFIFTNVATWYGGILGVGEFTYNYGIVSWFTQGFPYYIFAILFGIFFAKKVRNASLFTVPDKIEQNYGKLAGQLSAVLIFILVSPAPYLLMAANLLSLIFNIPLAFSLLISIVLSSVYLFRGGYKSYLFTDVFQFFVMFAGFIIIVAASFIKFGGFDYLSVNLPAQHLELSGGNSPAFIIVWFLIALWTFTDPGFHQRCYAAKDGSVAQKGIIISVLFWMLFDFLTTTTGLFSRAVLPNLNNPVLSFPLYAETVLGSGLKGLFYAAMFATILSTLNSFFFLSATTLGRDFIEKNLKSKNDDNLSKYTKYGLVISAVIAFVLCLFFDSVIAIWYTVGSICIPGIIFLVIGAYYGKFRVPGNIAVIEIITGVEGSLIWFFIRDELNPESLLFQIEPMIAGLAGALVVHLIGIRIAHR
ncbi:MAG: sodium:solute symporter family protein [Ignavibacteria bacterium]|nr:sodium:solute symporter family protein [Ignavibacteria bacterium]